MPLRAEKPTQQLVDLVGALRGTWSGYTAMCRCPAHDDRDPSLSIRQGDRGILVTCFAGCSREDVLRELRRVRTDTHYAPPGRTLATKRANVQRIWDQAIDVRGTLAERYLTRRNLVPPPPDVRFHPRCPYLPRPKTLFLPALLVAVREGREVVALQRNFLDRSTGDTIRKVMLGIPGTGAWRGREGGSTLAIAEGFETADAFFRLHGLACWASLGARRLNHLTIPATVTSLLIAEDNDPEGRRAAAIAEAHYARPDLIIERAPPPRQYNDWAKVLDVQARRVVD